MKHLLVIGRLFFGICIIGIGIMHFFYPGIRPIILPHLSATPSAIGYLTGIILILSGILVSIGKRFGVISLLMGLIFLALFLVGHLPAFLSEGPLNSDPWIKLNKILALAGGFLLIGAIDTRKSENKTLNSLLKFAPIGMYLYAIMLYNFSVAHIAKMDSLSSLVPAYIPFPKFWTFMGGIALMGSAISIFTKYRTRQITLLLAAVLFTWLLSLHFYYAIRFPKWNEGENFVGVITCLAFCGIALIISATVPRNKMAD